MSLIVQLAPQRIYCKKSKKEMSCNSNNATHLFSALAILFLKQNEKYAKTNNQGLTAKQFIENNYWASLKNKRHKGKPLDPKNAVRATRKNWNDWINQLNENFPEQNLLQIVNIAGRSSSLHLGKAVEFEPNETDPWLEFLSLQAEPSKLQVDNAPKSYSDSQRIIEWGSSITEANLLMEKDLYIPSDIPIKKRKSSVKSAECSLRGALERKLGDDRYFILIKMKLIDIYIARDDFVEIRAQLSMVERLLPNYSSHIDFELKRRLALSHLHLREGDLSKAKIDVEFVRWNSQFNNLSQSDQALVHLTNARIIRKNASKKFRRLKTPSQENIRDYIDSYEAAFRELILSYEKYVLSRMIEETRTVCYLIAEIILRVDTLQFTGQKSLLSVVQLWIKNANLVGRIRNSFHEITEHLLKASIEIEYNNNKKGFDDNLTSALTIAKKNGLIRQISLCYRSIFERHLRAWETEIKQEKLIYYKKLVGYVHTYHEDMSQYYLTLNSAGRKLCKKYYQENIHKFNERLCRIGISFQDL